MKLLILVFAVCGFSAFALEELKDSLDGIKISKDEVSKSLDTMRREGKISEADYAKTKQELGSMDQAQIDAINKKAIDLIRKNPDLDEVQKDLDNLSK